MSNELLVLIFLQILQILIFLRILSYVAYPWKDWYIVQRMFYDYEFERYASTFGQTERVVAERGRLVDVYNHAFADYDAALAFYNKHEEFRLIGNPTHESVNRILLTRTRSKAEAILRAPNDDIFASFDLITYSPFESLLEARKQAAEHRNALDQSSR